MLADKQRETFFFFLDTISELLHECHVVSELDRLELDVHKALALMERDFPVTKQVCACLHVVIKVVVTTITNVVHCTGHVCSFITSCCTWY